MFAISEVAPNGLAAGQSKSQQQVIASVMALQRVIAAQSGAESGDASARNFAGHDERDKAARNAERMKLRAEAEARSPAGQMQLSDRSAAAQSIVEAQEIALTDRKIVAAFQARHGITDLLSLIRDPEDRVLPKSPEE
jgi:hypothetical protein